MFNRPQLFSFSFSMAGFDELAWNIKSSSNPQSLKCCGKPKPAVPSMTSGGWLLQWGSFCSSYELCDYSHINGRTGGHFLYLAQGHVNSNSTHEGKRDILINLIKDKFSINSATNLLCYAAENILDFLQSENNVFKFCCVAVCFFTCPWKCWFNCSETDWNTCSKHFYWINRRSRPQRVTS